MRRLLHLHPRRKTIKLLLGLQHGFGHTPLGRLAKGRGTTDSPLRPTKSDPLSGQALQKETCVRIVKA